MSKILLDYYRLEWKYASRWIKVGDSIRNIEDAREAYQILVEQARDAGRKVKFRIVKITEEEVE
jgi:hypothetical protein